VTKIFLSEFSGRLIRNILHEKGFIKVYVWIMNQQQQKTSEIWVTNRNLVKLQARPENLYFQKSYDFMQEWMDGKEEFKLRTSGSTGTPKTIAITREQLASSAAMTGQALGLGKGTRALVCLNVEYVAGLMMLVRGMELDWELLIVEPSANPLLGFDQDAQFDFAAMVPMQLTSCLADPETAGQVKNLGKILLGGAPLSVSLRRQINDLKIPVFQSYGMTETVSHVALRKLNEVGENYKLLPGVEIGVDERGCLFVSGPMTNGEKIQTNDLVKMISQTEFVWLGRFDNVINSGGVKIILDRVDEQIAQVFYDMNCDNLFFSWFQEDEKLGQKLILIVQRSEQHFPEKAVIEEIRKRLSTYEVPKHVYLADPFVKTETDKIDKRQTALMLLKKING